MTKELNLFIGDTKEISTAKTNTKTTGEKTSGSLFDSILSSVKEEATSSKEAVSNENKPSQNPTSTSDAKSAQQVLKSDTPQTHKADHKVENNTQPNTQNASKVLNADESYLNKETKNSSSKNEKPTLSLLDRMMLEAGSKTQTNENKDIKPAVSTTPTTTQAFTPSTVEEAKTTQNTPQNTAAQESSNKENKTENKNTNNTETPKTVQATTSLFDAIVKEAKSSENKSEVSTNTKNIITDEEGKSTTSKENKQIVKQKSLNLDIPKEQITTTNINAQDVDILVEESNKNTDDTKTVPTKTVKEDTKPVQDKSLVMDLKEVPKEIKESAPITVDNSSEKKESVSENQNKNINISPKSELVQNKQSVKQEVNSNEIQKQDTDTKNIKQEVNKTEPLKQEVSKENIIVSQKETEVKKVVNSEVQTTKTVETSVVKNENVAKELSKITNRDIENKVNISKEDIDKLPSLEKPEKPEKQDTKRSLLDKLIDESKQIAKNKNSDEVKVEVPKSNESLLKQNVEKGLDPLVASMYLSSQKKNVSDASIVQVATGKKIASEASSVKDVEKSAKLLDLGLEDSEVTVKMQELEKHTKLNILDKLAFTKTVIKQDLIYNSSEIVAKQTVATNSATSTTNENETVVQLNVSPANITNIESRIIGARQQMGSMMSDVARNMYLNYKPPVTAFRMNLNPGTLGSIAIVMKSDKENGLSISLNMSNNATLDSFVDNQASLRASLAKNFNTETNFTLDFNMQGQDNNNSGSNSREDKQQNRSSHDETVMMQNMENSENQESTASDYM